MYKLKKIVFLFSFKIKFLYILKIFLFYPKIKKIIIRTNKNGWSNFLKKKLFKIFYKCLIKR